MFSRRLIFPLAGLAAAVATSGCTSIDPRTGSADPGFGEAIAWNKAVQTIDPDPAYGPDDAQPGRDGEKAQNATERYRRDQVKPVETIGTTSGASGGAGPR